MKYDERGQQNYLTCQKLVSDWTMDKKGGFQRPIIWRFCEFYWKLIQSFIFWQSLVWLDLFYTMCPYPPLKTNPAVVLHLPIPQEQDWPKRSQYTRSWKCSKQRHVYKQQEHKIDCTDVQSQSLHYCRQQGYLSPSLSLTLSLSTSTVWNGNKWVTGTGPSLSHTDQVPTLNNQFGWRFYKNTMKSF